MSSNTQNDDLAQQMQSLLDEAYQRGFQAGFKQGFQEGAQAALGIIQEQTSMEFEKINNGSTLHGTFISKNNNIKHIKNSIIHIRQRAPRGLAEVFVHNCLTNAGSYGVSIEEIKDMAETPDERMISVGTIGHKLREGVESGHYKKHGDKWFLA